MHYKGESRHVLGMFQRYNSSKDKEEYGSHYIPKKHAESDFDILAHDLYHNRLHGF